jgi:carbamoylphosphate synthase large subunit
MNAKRRKQIDKLSAKLVGVKNWLETFYTEAEARLATQCAETGGVTSAQDERSCEALHNAVKALEEAIDQLSEAVTQ